MAKVTITFEDTDDQENGVTIKATFDGGLDPDAVPTPAQSAAIYALEAVAEANENEG